VNSLIAEIFGLRYEISYLSNCFESRINISLTNKRGNMSEAIKKIGIPTLVVASALALVVLATSMVTPVFAKIQEVDTSCTNAGGNQPGGQQSTCTGGGLTQQSENQNPSGAAPPGQNK
jgi:hypothetical protein